MVVNRGLIASLIRTKFIISLEILCIGKIHCNYKNFLLKHKNEDYIQSGSV